MSSLKPIQRANIRKDTSRCHNEGTNMPQGGAKMELPAAPDYHKIVIKPLVL